MHRAHAADVACPPARLQVDTEEFQLLEAALEQAEQAYTAKVVTAPQQPQPSPDAQAPSAADALREEGGASGGVIAAAAAATLPPPRKRKLPASFQAVPGDEGPAPASTAASPTLPPLLYEGPVRYAWTAVEVDGLCSWLLRSGLTVLGFDIEWLVGGE